MRRRGHRAGPCWRTSAARRAVARRCCVRGRARCGWLLACERARALCLTCGNGSSAVLRRLRRRRHWWWGGSIAGANCCCRRRHRHCRQCRASASSCRPRTAGLSRHERPCSLCCRACTAWRAFHQPTHGSALEPGAVACARPPPRTTPHTTMLHVSGQGWELLNQLCTAPRCACALMRGPQSQVRAAQACALVRRPHCSVPAQLYCAKCEEERWPEPAAATPSRPAAASAAAASAAAAVAPSAAPARSAGTAIELDHHPRRLTMRAHSRRHAGRCLRISGGAGAPCRLAASSLLADARAGRCAQSVRRTAAKVAASEDPAELLALFAVIREGTQLVRTLRQS